LSGEGFREGRIGEEQFGGVCGEFFLARFESRIGWVDRGFGWR